MTIRFHTTLASPLEDSYATLIADATAAFRQDVGYAILIVESARSISEKQKRKKI